MLKDFSIIETYQGVANAIQIKIIDDKLNERLFEYPYVAVGIPQIATVIYNIYLQDNPIKNLYKYILIELRSSKTLHFDMIINHILYTRLYEYCGYKNIPQEALEQLIEMHSTLEIYK